MRPVSRAQDSQGTERIMFEFLVILIALIGFAIVAISADFFSSRDKLLTR